MIRARVVGRVALAAALVAASACAGATYGSGVGDRYLEQPPWEAGRGVVPEGQVVAWLPIGYQRGASQPPQFDPEASAGTPLSRLMGEMNAWLASLEGARPAAGATAAPGLPPDVIFGCETDAREECLPWEIGRPTMRLAVAKPSADWAAWAADAMGQAGAMLVLTLEVGQYLPRQRNILGEKEIGVGRDYRVPVPWLTSLETPVSVLQLTGALVDRNGKALRIGAEGLLIHRTSLLASSVGLQALITDEDVTRLRAARRDDLPGRPLVWQAALRNLVVGLLGE